MLGYLKQTLIVALFAAGASPITAQESVETQDVFFAHYVTSIAQECISAIETRQLNTTQLISYGYSKRKRTYVRDVFPVGAAGSTPAKIDVNFKNPRSGCRIEISPHEFDTTVLLRNLNETLYARGYKPFSGAGTAHLVFFKEQSKLGVAFRKISSGTRIEFSKLR
ncbi:hypothetical protein GCM10007939_02320 [Amylibacter marinus]|uniref:Uncharacterized protein n=1 Tax=Amylibacter marinus TaxID=1475483 RepID=A0ABQ5VS30_9RHOB|nr:hypothetical protein [Amylibacter marinus]GLQ33949.1 hypothetical protein GCM10007939_02320 [Amylibacter marinus]